MSKSDSPVSSAVHYDRKWAEKHVADFYTDYQRACLLFRLITNHSWEYPVDLLQRNPAKWERYKKIIKRITKVDVRMKSPLVTKEYTQLIEEEHLPKIIEEVKRDQLFAQKS